MNDADREQTQLPYHSRPLIYKGYRIQTYSFGNGPKTVLALPSFPFSGLYYLWFLRCYRLKTVKFITFDIPGWAGDSTNLFAKRKFTIREVVELANYVLAEYQVKHFSILGYSFGGAIALKLLARLPNQVKKIVLVSAVVKGKSIRSRSLLRLAFLAEKLNLLLIVKWFFLNRLRLACLSLSTNGIPQDYLDQYRLLFDKLDFKTMMEALHELVNTDCQAELDLINKLKLPITIVNSRDELQLFKKQAAYLRRQLQHEKSLYLEGSHNDFIIQPTTSTVKRVIDLLS